MKFYFYVIFFAAFSITAQNKLDCSKCSSELIDEAKLRNEDVSSLKLLKNEIYARKGYVFSNAEYANIFKKYNWYKPVKDNKSIVFSDTELRNIAIIGQRISELSEYLINEKNSKYKTLSEEKVNQIFTKEKRKELGIDFVIWKVYDYKDKTGSYYLVLTEDKYKETVNGNNFNNALKAFNFKIENNRWIKTFETNDFKESHEDSIWFWSKYIYVEDFDQDGIIDPIIIYGTSGPNLYDDGRIKILLYYKGKKIGIRIQNGILDDERNFTVDANFYALPKKIQDKIVEQMTLMVENNHSILPYGWQKKMAKKMTFIAE
ncbi:MULTISPECIES: M949_RS01915 family surface polysaccharide biosynthesis protein [Flavobacterium]|uniref:M949_RS01915 family surface polysaccharide biosynthesis protein n=1 Tax=Flavobacterium TaxID=237 RepID=UPI0011829014|nr:MULTISPECIES: YARHG domain-containing protein [Flavobacterium]MCR4030614.1 YARHG domain-containing protein [Flavobacterium panacis]